MVSRIVGLDHLTAVVGDADRAARIVARVLGVEACARLETATMCIHTFRLGGGVELHLNVPTGPGPLHEHHQRHGASLHHLAVRVEDLDACLELLAREGVGRRGDPIATAAGVREVFLDPEATAGLWIQLVERRGDAASGEGFDPRAIEALAKSGGEA